MKKTLRLFLIFAMVFSFSSCDLLTQLLGDNQGKTIGYQGKYKGETTHNWKVDKNGKVYFVKYNNSDDYKINGDYTGYVDEIVTRNAEVSEDDSIITNDETKFIHNKPILINDNEFINKLNHDFENATKKLISTRSAEVINSSTGTKSITHLNDTRDFYLIMYDYDSNGALKRQYSEKNIGKCEYVGEYCNVWFIDNSNYCSEDDFDFKELAEYFEKIYSRETKVMGSNKYTSHPNLFVDGNFDKVQIVLCDCMGDSYKNQDSGTFGYFSNIDMYDNDQIAKMDPSYGWSELVSNEDQIIYLDSLFYSYDGTKTKNNEKGYEARKQILSTIPHEFNHMLNFVQKTIKNNSEDSMETWYTEMLSLISEDLFMEFLDIEPLSSSRGRLDYFNDYYNYGFTTWFSGEDVFISYANAFAYGAFLCRNYGGEKLINEIATNNYTNKESITKALQKLGYNKTFEDTFKELANVLVNTSSSGITLNKSGNVITDGLSLTAINLNFKDSSGNSSAPKIYKNEAVDDIYPKGFTIHYLGQNLKSFTYYSAIGGAEDYITYDVIVK